MLDYQKASKTNGKCQFGTHRTHVTKKQETLSLRQTRLMLKQNSNESIHTITIKNQKLV
jgi:hypothetical protein